MFGRVTGKVNVDPVELAKAFKDAFDADVITFNMNADYGHQNVMGSHGYVAQQLHNTSYTLHISCCMANLPITRSLMDHFSIPFLSDARLVKISTTSQTEPSGLVSHALDLTYVMLDYGKFVSALKNIAYNRFSDKFHQQLDDILD